MRALGLFLALGLSMHACFLRPASDGCKPGSSRCAANTVQVCNGDSQWRNLHDCEAIATFSGAAIACVADGGAAACVVRDAGAE